MQYNDLCNIYISNNLKFKNSFEALSMKNVPFIFIFRLMESNNWISYGKLEKLSRKL
jgi:hypothetical protein